MKAIVVLFDTLNRRFLPSYGADWTHMPNFERLAKASTTFDTCYGGSMPCMPAESGETVSTVLEVPSRLLCYWDNGWMYEPGEYRLRTGFSVSDLPSTVTMVLKP